MKISAARRRLAVRMVRIAVLAFLIFITGYHPLLLQARVPQTDQSARRDIGATPENPYVGAAGCAHCHAAITALQTSTSMARAATDPANTAGVVKGVPYASMTYREGPYTSSIVSRGDHLQMQVASAEGSVAAPIRWIFGSGRSGQTFILQRDGKYYESRASYYSTLENLDLTVGHSHTLPSSLFAALGRPLPADEVMKCFSCHMSENTFAGQTDPEKAHPGVSCENCHGAGAAHVAAVSDPQRTQSASRIFNPGALAPMDMVDFCGSCHRTTQDVLQTGIRDIRNIRFQPYRLENSKCYDPTDLRITCVACHDPHRELSTVTEGYDNKCLACHRGTGKQVEHATIHACPKATHGCVNCHMRKLPLPGVHYSFTDHFIRIYRDGERYPG